MRRYRLYGLTMETELEFPQLVEEKSDVGVAPVIYVEETEVPEEVIHSGKKLYEFGENYSWLKNDTVRLVVENGERIGYQLTGGGWPEHLQTYILGYGMSMLAMQRGILAIHCSAVADENGAVLIAGESGAGKSTVTTAFLERGYRLMADDMAFVATAPGGSAMAYPAFPFQKLCRNVAMEKDYSLEEMIYIDEDKDKFLVPYRGEFSTQPMPVKAFIMLGLTKEGQVRTEEITGFNRLHIYVNNLFLRHFLGGKKYDPAIGQRALEMAASVPTYMVSRPIQGDTTEQVISAAIKLTE